MLLKGRYPALIRKGRMVFERLGKRIAFDAAAANADNADNSHQEPKHDL